MLDPMFQHVSTTLQRALFRNLGRLYLYVRSLKMIWRFYSR